MGTPLSADLRAVRANVDALLGVIGTDTVLKPVRFRNEYRGPCPFHGGHNPTSFHVFYDHPDECWRYRCYSCKARGDVFDYLVERTGVSFKEAIERFAWQSSIPRRPVQPPPPPPKALPPREAAIRAYYEALYKTTSTGKSAWDEWRATGLSARTISRFNLGYAPACPTYRDSDSLTIPVTYRDQILNIRHRLLHPPSKGDKYRPQKAGLGVHLFNADSLDIGQDDALIVEGEKKALVLCDMGFEGVMPVVSSTGGVSSWLSGAGESWYEMLMDFGKVYVLFDPEKEAREQAERTARLFGRRGHIVHVPGKVDDYILGDEHGYTLLLNAISVARNVLQGGYWTVR